MIRDVIKKENKSDNDSPSGVKAGQENVLQDDYGITEWLDEEAFCNEPLDKEMVKAQEEEDDLESMKASLAKQICNEINEQDEMNKQDNILTNKSWLPRWAKITGITLGTVLAICVLLLFTPFGKNILFSLASNYAYGQMNYEDSQEVAYQVVKDDVVEEAILGKSKNILDSNIQWNTEVTDLGGRTEKGIVNILLLGEEAIDSGSSRGRTDLMIIATMNTKDKSVKLTSLMRDMLVQIPDHQDNKLNSAYEMGGVPLLYETIEHNFDIKMNGYALVDFDSFEDIINKLGGVRITLTGEEARYLKKTNYISNPVYRNVVEGSQILNGNQALGYCRIRYVATDDHQLNDYGRTSRQRVVLNAIFDQYKTKSLPELALLLNDILPLVTTDIKKTDFDSYLKAAVTMGLSEIEDQRIPADKTFEEGYVRKMSVLIPDQAANIEVLHKFIFGSIEP